ncbi:GNAT family N-acetyltransferase [Azospirillum sp. SYSU D00513]|uniref:GNAT family N-acetyltransferase n=1 Tax=Azospirillum sp. SYSU D00513 TaxID=2812561 RepID=UPI001A9705A0|nr:GNAT family N-acetyltransferase [Azospirillum sp. SYSU D00513]
MSVIRKLLPAELALYRAHLLRLDKADRYARFTGTTSDTTIVRHCDGIDWSRTLLIGAFIGGELRGVVELCSDRMLWPADTELAISVEKPFQEMGLGSALVRRALTIARNRFAKRLHLYCLAENRRMRALARKFGGRAEQDGGDVTITLDLPPANQFSLALEALEESAGAVDSLLGRWRAGRPDLAAA